MRFEWDIRKDRSNRAKHDISFELAQLAFADPFKKDKEVQFVDGAERWVSIARLPTGQILVLVSAERWDAGDYVIRIISARRADRHERRAYEEDP